MIPRFSCGAFFCASWFRLGIAAVHQVGSLQCSEWVIGARQREARGTEEGWKQKDFDLMQIFKSSLFLSLCFVPFREIVFKWIVSNQGNSTLGILDGRLN
jgi:hypothetical protein